MTEKEYLAQRKNPLNDEQLLHLAALGSSTAACVALVNSTIACSLPANDSRVRRAESCAKKVLVAVAEFLSACGLDLAPPAPEALGMKSHNGIPLVPGWIIGPNPEYPGNWIVKVYCPYCRIWHLHGWAGDPDPSVPQHRNAHCHFWPPITEIEGESPLRETGYYIELDASSRKIVAEAGGQNQ